MWLFHTLVACAAFGASAALQKHGVAAAAPRISWTALRRPAGVVAAVLASRAWLVGVVTNLAGVVFVVLAIAGGELSVVQPLLNLSMVVAGLVGLVFLRERLRPLEWVGAAILVAGAVLVGVSGASVPPPATLEPAPGALRLVVLGGILALAVLGGLATLTTRFPQESLLAVMAGVLFGLAAVLVKWLLGGDGPGVLPLGMDPRAWGALLCGLAGFMLQQGAYSHGRVTVVSPVVTITAMAAPLVAAAWGFGEVLSESRIAGVALVVGGLGFLVAAGLGAEAGVASPAEERQG